MNEPALPEDSIDGPGVPPERLGWDQDWAAALAAVGTDLIAGRISRQDRGWVTAVCRLATVRSELATAGDHPELLADPPVTGDWVGLAPAEGHAVVEAVLPRRGSIVRHSADGRGEPQILAANVDLAVIVHGLDRPLNTRRLERILTIAWESGATPVVAMTKADIASDAQFSEARSAIEGITHDVEVVLASVVDGTGIDVFHRMVEPNKTMAFMGESGAGKSSLVNILVGNEVMEVGEVRAGDAKGRHTTTTRELFLVPGGGVLIDTPGLRAVGLWLSEEGRSRAFPDIAGLADACRFDDCTHDHEPGCAVVGAVEAGSLSAARLESYLRLQAEAEELAARLESRRRGQGRGGRRR